MAKRKIPGLSIAVIRSGKLIRAEGYGFANLRLEHPRQETGLRDRSISKQFAAEAVMLLVEDGKLRVDDPITVTPPMPREWKR